MRALVATYDAHSHVQQTAVLVRRLVRQGHTVQWLLPESWRGVVEATGATLIPTLMTPAHPHPTAAPYRDWVWRFVREGPLQEADLTMAILEFEPDVLLVDPTVTAVRDLAAKYDDLAMVMLGCLPLLHVPGAVDLVLQATLPQMEYPVTCHTPVAFVGPLLPPPDATRDVLPEGFAAWRRPELPLLLVTQGTLATDPEVLIRPVLAALAEWPVQVLATAAPYDGQPENALCAPWVPFATLLPQVACVLSSGGYATAQWCLAAGVPLIAAGETEEKPEVAARVAWAGYGESLSGAPLTAEAIQTATRTVLMNPRYRAEAQRLAAQVAFRDPATIAVQVLESWMASRIPNVEEEATHAA